MTFWRCALLLVVVACGGSGTAITASEPKPVVGEPVAAPPAAVKPVAVAIVMEGWEMWIGNDQLVDEAAPDSFQGALKPLKDAFARVSWSSLPAGSRATVVTYTDHASVRHPMAPIAKLSAAALGEQKDYFGVIDRDLVGGVTLGLDELAKVTDARRVLIVIGDGDDTMPEAAKAALATLAKRAQAENVEVLSIVYEAPLSSPGNVIGALDPNAVVVNSIDAIVDQMSWSFVRLAQPPAVAATGPTPFALALLFNGAEVWTGNDDLVPANDPSRYIGALKSIRAAFERAPMTGFAAGSKAMVITYDSKARTRVPLMPIEGLDAGAIGVQKDYYGTFGIELVGGVRFAFTELAKVQAGRRVLIILGDGGDTNNEAARIQLRALAKQAAELHIEVYALVYKGQLSDETTVVTELDPKAATAATGEQLTADLVALFRVLHKR
ncbi:MAG: VWA domain-containing protein [Deltaproteobacteria bacterium]|nr:VWA domain-containing protein [Deltaproteobacteria bacterium]